MKICKLAVFTRQKTHHLTKNYTLLAHEPFEK